VVEITPRPNFVALGDLVRIRPAASEEPRSTGVPAATDPLVVPLRLEAVTEGPPRPRAVLVPWAQSGWFRRLLFALPASSLRSYRVAFLEMGVLVLASDRMEGIPFGQLLEELIPGALVPVGARLRPALSPDLLAERLGISEGSLCVFPALGAPPFRVAREAVRTAGAPGAGPHGHPLGQPGWIDPQPGSGRQWRQPPGDRERPAGHVAAVGISPLSGRTNVHVAPVRQPVPAAAGDRRAAARVAAAGPAGVDALVAAFSAPPERLTPGSLSVAEDHAAHELGRARARRARALLLDVPAPPLDEPSFRLGAAVHDLLLLAHPALGPDRTDPARTRIAEAALALADLGPPRDAAEAVRRHSLLARLPEVVQPERLVSYWLGRQRFVGRTPPARVLAMPRLRRVRMEETRRLWLKEVGCRPTPAAPGRRSSVPARWARRWIRCAWIRRWPGAAS
jgi:hypothetical protein